MSDSTINNIYFLQPVHFEAEGDVLFRGCHFLMGLYVDRSDARGKVILQNCYVRMGADDINELMKFAIADQCVFDARPAQEPHKIRYRENTTEETP